MKTAEEYELLAKKAAYLIVQAIRLFKDEPANIQEQAQQVINGHVQRMLHGEKVIVDCAVTEVNEAGPAR